jgi:hypothetical protein
VELQIPPKLAAQNTVVKHTKFHSRLQQKQLVKHATDW